MISFFSCNCLFLLFWLVLRERSRIKKETNSIILYVTPTSSSSNCISTAKLVRWLQPQIVLSGDELLNTVHPSLDHELFKVIKKNQHNVKSLENKGASHAPLFEASFWLHKRPLILITQTDYDRKPRVLPLNVVTLRCQSPRGWYWGSEALTQDHIKRVPILYSVLLRV